MSSQLIRSGECRKFSPNIFNKTKCTNCFRQKEEHSAEALESNRASRKIAKCGYLFVAPGWDFTNPINRTKRWQRRWFVLYDDGELSYSLDEHPETVPQASIDMNKVVEVTAAEELTGNPYSLAITAPDVVHFVKGTSREEARFWTDVLSVFPRSKGRHKRNATFPGTQPSTKTNHILQTPPIRGNNSPNSEVATRNQYNTCLSTPVWEGDDVFPTKETPPKSSPIEQPPNPTDTRKVYMGSPPTRDKVDKVDEKIRSRRVVNREKRGLKTGRSFSEDISKMVPPVWSPEKTSPTGHTDMSRLHLDNYENDIKIKELTESISRPRGRSLSNHLEPTRDNDFSSHRQVRGDPDGCGLDPSLTRVSPSDLRLDLPSDDLLNIKRGWLMKQGQDKDWNKHWFVLRGNGLLYYRDPKAEDQSILDGVIDLSGISSCTETQVQRNYGFQLTTWDNRLISLSALTAGIRSNWMSAIRKAAGLQEPPGDLSSPVDSVDSVIPPRSLLFSSDDEYRTASEGGRRESGEWGEALPPSPPLNRTPMSRVKERARGVSKWRGLANKRSRSSPPSSRRSTLDSISSQELLTATHQVPENKMKEPAEEQPDFIVYREKPTLNNSSDDIKEKKRSADLVALEKKVEDLLKKEEETGRLRARDSAELEALKTRYNSEKEEWERAVVEAESELEQTSGRLSATLGQLGEAREKSERLAGEVERLEARLASAIEENEALYSRLRPGSGRTRSVDSLSDLTNIDLTLDLNALDKDRMIEEYTDLRSRFEKAVSEIRALKRELRESQAQCDWLELSLVSARQEGIGMKNEAEASSSLMAARIQDLATKLSASEKQVRMLKQKLAKTETREKRRSLSLKGRESFTICKELEEKLSELEKKMSTIEMPGGTGKGVTTKVVAPAPVEVDKKGDRLRRKSLDSATSSEPLKVLLRLRNLEAKLSMAQEKSNEEKQIELKLFNGDADDSENQKGEMVNEVKKMENLLRAKLLVLAKKKESLIKAGQWTNEAKLNLLAEKLAYESVLIGRLHDAVMESKSLDLTDAERLITSLDNKISGGKPNIETSLDYLVKSLAKHLTQQGVKRVSRKPKERKKPDPIITELLNKKSSIDAKVENYINTVVDNLAESFAVESLADDAGTNKTDCLQAAWSMAQEAVNQELIQVEISQVLAQCSQTYHSYIENENETRFSGIVKERANLEMWASLADENLKNDMGAAIEKLKAEYKKRLNSLKIENHAPIRPTIEDEEKTRTLLNHFVDIVAHKSLLDARITVLCNGEYSDIEPEQGVFDENSILSEIQFLYVKFCRELTQDSKDEERLKEVVDRLAKEVYALARVLNQPEVSEKTETGDTWIESLCRKCEHLKERLVSLQKCAEDSKECSSCSLLHEEILRLENHHASEIQELEKRQEKEIAKVKEEFEEQKASLIKHYKEEEEKLIDRNNRLERRLETWEAEYSQQTEDMKSAFNNISSSGFEDEESMRRRYQAEIQHLKAVCEKGLDCMESSHRRQIQELQEKHERELSALRLEKEQALTEETHATLAALDAMRKAHEAEVQKEVAKFKAEYVSKMQSNHDLTALHNQHQAEMEEIKREILSLSDKYSIKCVESASLEDKLRIANQQLAHAHQHIMQLDARNRQLRAHLVAEASNDSLPRLQEHSHGVGSRASSQPRVVNAIPKKPAAIGSKQTYTKPSVSYSPIMEPPPLPKAEVKRSPDSLNLCGMVSKRRQEFERIFTSACTDRPTLI